MGEPAVGVLQLPIGRGEIGSFQHSDRPPSNELRSVRPLGRGKFVEPAHEAVVELDQHLFPSHRQYGTAYGRIDNPVRLLFLNVAHAMRAGWPIRSSSMAPFASLTRWNGSSVIVALGNGVRMARALPAWGVDRRDGDFGPEVRGPGIQPGRDRCGASVGNDVEEPRAFEVHELGAEEAPVVRGG